MGFPFFSHGLPWEFSAPVGIPWELVVLTWEIHTSPMGISWDFSAPMGPSWRSHGLGVSYGTSMGLPWNFRLPMGILWEYIVLPWEIHVSPTGLRWEYHRGL